MLAIVDYAAGNQTSVARALSYLRIPCRITGNAKELAGADGIIFPGVGSAAQAMRHLEATGLGHVLLEAVEAGKPLLGICLGCQILLDFSEEGNTRTLGLIRGGSVKFPPDMREEDGSPAPVPHMGWNGIHIHASSPLLAGIPDGSEFYFVHSYHALPPEGLVIATARYGREFCAIYGRDGLWAVQFHVEKSGPRGMRILQNFHDYCRSGAHAV